MAMYWIESILCVFLLSLRFYARRKIRGFGADDWMMLVTVASTRNIFNSGFT
jgi:hypothetical protein